MVEIPVNIGMVEFYAGKYCDPWAVVKKFWSFIKKGRVVFVALYDEILAFSNIQDTKADVVVLPWVPLITMVFLSLNAKCFRAWGKER